MNESTRYYPKLAPTAFMCFCNFDDFVSNSLSAIAHRSGVYYPNTELTEPCQLARNCREEAPTTEPKRGPSAERHPQPLSADGTEPAQRARCVSQSTVVPRVPRRFARLQRLARAQVSDLVSVEVAAAELAPTGGQLDTGMRDCHHLGVGAHCEADVIALRRQADVSGEVDRDLDDIFVQ